MTYQVRDVSADEHLIRKVAKHVAPDEVAHERMVEAMAVVDTFLAKVGAEFSTSVTKDLVPNGGCLPELCIGGSIAGLEAKFGVVPQLTLGASFDFKAKLELFAEHTHDQGMVSRLTVYKDRARTIVKECREAFTHRRDRLASRVRYPLEGKVRERFLPGRQLSLKELVEWAGRRRGLPRRSRSSGAARA